MKIWKPIEGFSETHEVSNSGEVRRIVPGKTGQRPGLLSPVLLKIGYYRYTLYRGGKYNQIYAHALVSAAFLGPRPAGFQVNHKNGVKTDNRVRNLEYVSHQENMRHAREVLGSLDCRHSGNRHNAKLTDAQVIELRARSAGGETGRSLSHSFGISEIQVSRIIRRLCYPNLQAAA